MLIEKFLISIFTTSFLYIPVYVINDYLNYYDDLKKAEYNAGYRYRVSILFKDRNVMILYAIGYIAISFIIIAIQGYILYYETIILLLILLYLTAVIHSMIHEKYRPISSFIVLRIVKHLVFLIIFINFLMLFNGCFSLIAVYIVILLVSIPYILYNALLLHKGRKILRLRSRTRYGIVAFVTLLSFLTLIFIIHTIMKISLLKSLLLVAFIATVVYTATTFIFFLVFIVIEKLSAKKNRSFEGYIVKLTKGLLIILPYTLVLLYFVVHFL